MNKGILLVLFALALVIIPVSAQEVESLGTFKTESCVTLKQTCANCTYINFSLSIPPNQTTFIFNQSMVRQTLNLWTFNFCNTSINGQYVYDTYGDLDSNIEQASVNFFVNPIGKTLSEAQANLYSMIFIFAFILFLICLVAGIASPKGNKRDEMTGYVIAVSNLKYVKMLMLAVAYLLLMLMLYFGYIISYGYLDLDFLGNLFRAAFFFMVAALLPLFIVSVYVVIANAIRDHKIGDMISRGLRVK